jgi:hypothetical protein
VRKANRVAPGCSRGAGAGRGGGRQLRAGGGGSEKEDEEMEREDERGVAKRPDLNKLDVPEWAELALHNVEWRKLLQCIAF